MPRKFQRRKEDFTCTQCGQFVHGDGYTNHCPHCLWSRHVDINPGDRAAQCGGMLQPIAIETRNNQYILIHRCQTCGIIRRNKTAPNDNFEALLALAAQGPPPK